MDFFRKLIIGTLHAVAILFFFGLIIWWAAAGYYNGEQLAAQAAQETGASAPALPSWGYAIIGAIAGWVVASVVLGLLFVLLDIQDGIRDLIRLQKGETVTTTTIEEKV